MIAQSFEITVHISKSISYQIENFSSLVLWLSGFVFACNHKAGGSIPCQAKATLFTRSVVFFSVTLTQSGNSIETYPL